MNKNTIRYFLMLRMVCVMVLVVGLCSCDSDRSGIDGAGSFRIALTPDTTAINKGINTTKSALSDEFESFLQTADYKVAIIQSDDTIQLYERFDQMPDEIEIKAGSYRFVAFKGDNVAAAFSNPYFEGSSNFTIKENMTTPVDLTCVLANARITTDFTDDFKAMYEVYTVQLSSPYTKDPIEVAQDETRPVYMQVTSTGSELGIAIRLKKINETEEKTYTIPAPLAIERRQNIRLIFKTDGASIDNIGLDVLLDNELTNVTLTAGIPDFMWQQFAKPEITAVNFDEGIFDIHSGLFIKDPSVTFRAPAGIGGFYIDVWKDEADITNDPEAKGYDLSTPEGAQAAFDDGFVWDEKANPLSGAKKEFVLSLNKAINSLPAPVDKDHYQYTMRIYMRDNLPKSNYTDTLSLTINVKQADAPIIDFPAFPLGSLVEGDTQSSDIKATLLAQSGIDKENSSLSIITDEGEMTINFNDNTNIATLENLGISIKEMSASKTEVTFRKEFSKYLNALATSSQYKFAFAIKEKGEKNRTAQQERSLEVKAPQFSIVSTDGDAFAKRIVLRSEIYLGDSDKLYFQYQKPGDGDIWTDLKDNKKAESLISYVDTLKSLNSLTEYNVRAVYKGARSWFSESVALRTEDTGVIPNGEFEEWSIAADANGNQDEGSKVDINGITGLFTKVPFPYRCWEVWQPWNSSLSKGWNTLNLQTTKDGGLHNGLASNTTRKWTRYTANSGTVKAQGINGNCALIRTVGWGSGNSATTDGGLGTVKHLTPGELYLGSYNGEANYGIPFNMRPLGFRFDYKYIKKTADKFIAEIVVLNHAGEIIANSTLKLGNNEGWSSEAVMLDYNGVFRQDKAANMYIRFVSGESTSTNDLMIFPPASNLSYGEYIGSQLYIDNVELIYE